MMGFIRQIRNRLKSSSSKTLNRDQTSHLHHPSQDTHARCCNCNTEHPMKDLHEINRMGLYYCSSDDCYEKYRGIRESPPTMCLNHPEEIVVGTCCQCYKDYCMYCMVRDEDSGFYYCNSPACRSGYTEHIDEESGICVQCNQRHPKYELVFDNKLETFHCINGDCYGQFVEQQKSHFYSDAEEILNNKFSKELFDKYLKGKSLDFMIAVNRLANDERIFDPDNYMVNSWTGTRDLELIFYEIYSTYLPPQNNSSDVDEKLALDELHKHANKLKHDIDMLSKLFSKKSIELSQCQILFSINSLIKNKLSEFAKPIIEPILKKITTLNVKDKKAIIKLFIESQGPCMHKEIYIKVLLDKLDLQYTEAAISSLISEVQDEIELDNFERNLGRQQENIISEDFDVLDGYQFEHYTKKLLDLLGYTSIVTGKSYDYGADLIAKKNDTKIVVQCKRYKDSVSNKAIQEVVAAKKHYNCQKTLVIATSSFTNSAIVLAKSNDVELWDRETLKRIVEKVNSRTLQEEI